MIDKRTKALFDANKKARKESLLIVEDVMSQLQELGVECVPLPQLLKNNSQTSFGIMNEQKDFCMIKCFIDTWHVHINGQQIKWPRGLSWIRNLDLDGPSTFLPERQMVEMVEPHTTGLTGLPFNRTPEMINFVKRWHRH